MFNHDIECMFDRMFGRSDLVGLHHVNARFYDVDYQDPKRGLSRGAQLREEHGRSFAAVMTCQQQSICILFPAGASEVIHQRLAYAFDRKSIGHRSHI